MKPKMKPRRGIRGSEDPFYSKCEVCKRNSVTNFWGEHGITYGCTYGYDKQHTDSEIYYDGTRKRITA